MKRVRFESPIKLKTYTTMSESDCHSRRPYLQNPIEPKNLDCYSENETVLVYSSDPIQRFETSNSLPYPTVSKSYAPEDNAATKYMPSNELELSMLDGTNFLPRKSIQPLHVRNSAFANYNALNGQTQQILSPIDNIKAPLPNYPPNTLAKDHDFFIRRHNIDKHWKKDYQLLQSQFNRLSFDKENNPLELKAQMMNGATKKIFPAASTQSIPNTKMNCQPLRSDDTDNCKCYHCIPNSHNKHHIPVYDVPNCHRNNYQMYQQSEGSREQVCQELARKSLPQCNQCPCMTLPPPTCHCKQIEEPVNNGSNKSTPPEPCDKKSWKLERIEKMNAETLEIEKQSNITNENKEPTVADLFEIIKMQNKQLQLLQDQVDRFISASKQEQDSQPVIPNCITEQVITTVTSQPQMSVGVMTSFELVRTSTIINKEIVKQTTDNAQVQCNRSQISIKEVVSRTKPVNQNFLDGISPKVIQNRCNGLEELYKSPAALCETVPEEKTYNEMSLYDVQVDNPITPLISPDQSLYLDVRDYSNSESANSDQSNVGWTYYNKVMTHVNGMLQDSDMPSSASALFRNMKQQCVQMQIDKTNVSVAKRVKFGDDPLGIQQPHIYGSTDTSLKMNELAAKYLNSRPIAPILQTPKQTGMPFEMSFATRNYMERHKILQGVPTSTKHPTDGNIPRFLDITALKNQPKLL